MDTNKPRTTEVTQALKEHYGISLSASVINKITRRTGIAAKAFNAESMGQLKTLQANGHRENLWQKLAA